MSADKISSPRLWMRLYCTLTLIVDELYRFFFQEETHKSWKAPTKIPYPLIANSLFHNIVSIAIVLVV